MKKTQREQTSKNGRTKKKDSIDALKDKVRKDDEKEQVPDSSAKNAEVLSSDEKDLLNLEEAVERTDAPRSVKDKIREQIRLAIELIKAGRDYATVLIILDKVLQWLSKHL